MEWLPAENTGGNPAGVMNGGNTGKKPAVKGVKGGLMLLGITAFLAAAMFNRNGLYRWGEWKPATIWCGAWMSVSFGGGLGIESNISAFDFLMDGEISSFIILSIVNAWRFLAIGDFFSGSLLSVSWIFVYFLGWMSVDTARGVDSLVSSSSARLQLPE